MKISKNGSVISINTEGDDTIDVSYVEKAFKHWDYLKTYRKGYSKKRKAKNAAVRNALEKKGVDVEKLEKEAVAKLAK
jgi:hypothetical protein